MNKPSPLHIHCPHFEACSGCSVNEDVDNPLILNEMRQYFKIKGQQLFQLHAGKATGWRTRAKLAVRGNSKEPLIGLYKEGSHQVIDIPLCKVHHPSINKGVAVLKSFIQDFDIMPYQEESGKGLLRYIQFVVERSTGKLNVTFVVNAETLGDWKRLGEELWNKDPSLFHSIWFNGNTNRTNVIFGSHWHHLKGSALLWDRLAGTDVCFQPANFAQANLSAFEELLIRIREIIPSYAKVAEFYAGVGVIGLSLVKQVQRVDCVEVSQQSEYCFKQSLAKLTEKESSKIAFHTGKADTNLNLLNDADWVIVDPPRKGLDRPLLEKLTQKNILYISCGWKGFQKDCDFLLKKGYKIASAEGYLFFPGTNHVELLVHFIEGR